MTKSIRDNADSSCIDLLVDGERVGEIGYRRRPDGLHLVHTEIDPEKREKGLASDFVEITLQHFRESTSERIVADCPYVAHWLGEHSGYEDLLTR